MAFKAGTSGNPNGRPKGTGHRQQLFRIVAWLTHTQVQLSWQRCGASTGMV